MIETKFRNTEIGPIPADWEVKSIAEVAPLQRGFDLPKSCLTPGDYPVVYSNGIGYYHNQFQCKAPGLVTGRSGTIGKFTLISKGYYWPHNTTLWVTNFNNNNPLYLYYRYSTLSFEDSATGTGVPTLNRNYLKDKKIAMPPLAEQEAIGEALREVDELIEGLKKLVAKKRAIKQGAMSQLLSGKSRLPGFSEPWKETVLSEVSSYGNTTAPTDIFEEVNYVCTENMISNRGGILPYEGFLLYEYVKNYVPFDILISNIRPYLKKIWLADRAGGVSADVLVIRPEYEKIDSSFLYCVLSQDNFFDYVMDGVSGTKMPRGNKKHIMNYSFMLPTSLAEQEAIAKVLTDMDAEIEALSRKVAKYEQVKQGMMQQLLTGKIRLVKHPIA